MNGSEPVGVDKARSARSLGSVMTMRKVLSSTTSMLATNFSRVRPMPSPAAQRLIDATQSSALTGLPSCHLRPGRSVMVRSEEHTSELQSLMRISYAVFCLKKKIQRNNIYTVLQLEHTNNLNLKL